ncbi:MAG: hypothetical protein GKR89_03180 [Candidatus Latescibacteria bacterium]|nr:hypothetical protein [Candidatus Latescibacterota bacterium]
MTAEQTPPELTTRDVLAQVDRRLTLIEEDVRALDSKVDTRFDFLDQKLGARIGALEHKLDTRVDALDQKLGARIDTLDQKLDGKVDELRGEMHAGFTRLDEKIEDRTDALRREMHVGFGDVRKESNTRFHWILGVVLASWISTIGTLLLK